MKSDSDIKRDVEAELRWCPEIDATDLAVKVRGGVVTLSGYAQNYFEKHRAEAAAKRVLGVTALADDVKVRLPPCEGLTDPEIACNALTALKLELPMCWEAIQVFVQEREVRLEGTVAWNFQRESAESAMCKLRGVIGVQNSIGVKAITKPTQIKHLIEQAFQRSAQVDASKICVEAHGSEVTLRGQVRSWTERDQAQATAWFAPGVHCVNNEIVVKPDREFTFTPARSRAEPDPMSNADMIM